MIEIFFKNKWIIVTIVYLITAIFSVGYFHFDEHFQVIEFACLKLGLNKPADMPWEYHFQLRSAFQPLIVYLICKLFYFLKIFNPFHIALVLRFLSVCLALYATFVFYNTFEKKLSLEKNRKIFFILSFLLWFAVYHKVRFSSENWSACLFIIGFCKYFNQKEKSTFNLILIGFLLGLSFITKFQTGFFTLGFMAWLFFIQKEKILSLIYISLGIVIAFVLGIAIDSWFYSQPVITAYNYLQQLLFSKYHQSSFGGEPWWYFFSEVFLRSVPPFSIYILSCFAALFVIKPKDVLTWILFPFIFIHFFIGHKEIRFLFPAIPFIPFLMIYGHEILSNKFPSYLQLTKTKVAVFFVTSFWVLNIFFVMVTMFKSADLQIPLYQYVYNNFQKPVIIYYTDSNPYSRVLDVRFYRRRNVVIKHLDSLSQIKNLKDTTCLYVTEKPLSDFPKEIKYHQLYNSFPAWVNHFNFNNWLSRTKSWHLIEIEK